MKISAPLLFLLAATFLFTLLASNLLPQDQAPTKVDLISSFVEKIGLDLLIIKPGQDIEDGRFNFDHDNETWFIEFVPHPQSSGKILATLEAAQNKSSRIAIYPPPEWNQPFFSGRLIDCESHLLLKGIFSNAREIVLKKFPRGVAEGKISLANGNLN